MTDGRRPKLTPELQTEICELIADGNYYGTTAHLVGLGRSTFFEWMSKGREAKRRTIYRDFLDAVEKADAEAIKANIDTIKKASTDHWQAAAWWLERKHPDEWGRVDRAEVTGPGGGPVVVEHDINIKDDLIARIVGIASRRASADDNREDEPGASG